MAEFAPQYNLYKTVSNFKFMGNLLFWLIPLLAITPYSIKIFNDSINITDVINILNIICIVVFFIIEIVVEYILIPIAENKRRDDFIDNSFGSKHQKDNSIGYFDNDSVNLGLYKAAVNLFENCFFTYSLVKDILPRRIIIPAFMFILILIVSYFGLKQNPIYLTVLQIFFSINILGVLVKNIVLFNRLYFIEDNWITLFQTPELKNNIYNHQSTVYRCWLQYETLLSIINADIPDKFFLKNNPKLTANWGKIKVKYKIN